MGVFSKSKANSMKFIWKVNNIMRHSFAKFEFNSKNIKENTEIICFLLLILNVLQNIKELMVTLKYYIKLKQYRKSNIWTNTLNLI